MKRPIFLVLIAVIVLALIGGLAVSRAQKKAVQNLPDYLQAHMVPFLHIDSVEMKKEPLELVLHNVVLKDPDGFNGGDAFRIDRVNVAFDRNPFWNDIHINTITFHRVRGEFKTRGQANNFAILLQQLMERKGQTPRGLLAKPTTLKQMTIYRSSIQSEDASAFIPLADYDYAPTGALTDTVPLQHVIADVLGAMIQHEQKAVDLLEVKEIKEKTKDMLKSFGDSVKEYLTTP